MRVRAVNSSTFQTSAALSFNRQSREQTLMMCKHPRKRGSACLEKPRGGGSRLCPAGCPSRSPEFRSLSVRLSPAHLLRPGIDLSPPPPPNYSCSCWKFPWKWPVETSSLPSPHTAVESWGLAEVTPPEGNVSLKQMGLNIAQYPQSELH